MCRNLDFRFLLFIVFCHSFFPAHFRFFWLSILSSFLILTNWFLFLSFFVFPLFWHCFIPVSLSHVVSFLAYPNLLETKMIDCCYCCMSGATNYRLVISHYPSQDWAITDCRGRIVGGAIPTKICYIISTILWTATLVITYTSFSNSPKNHAEARLVIIRI
jgi:hypothetical protein